MTGEIRFIGERSTGLIDYAPTTTIPTETVSQEMSIGPSIGLSGTTPDVGVNFGFSAGYSIATPQIRILDRSDQTDYDIQFLYYGTFDDEYHPSHYTYHGTVGYTVIDYDRYFKLTIWITLQNDGSVETYSVLFNIYPSE